MVFLPGNRRPHFRRIPGAPESWLAPWPWPSSFSSGSLSAATLILLVCHLTRAGRSSWVCKTCPRWTRRDHSLTWAWWKSWQMIENLTQREIDRFGVYGINFVVPYDRLKFQHFRRLVKWWVAVIINFLPSLHARLDTNTGLSYYCAVFQLSLKNL